MGIQLYPPIIPATLDAMYKVDNEGIFIKIPFELNRAVSANQIYNFRIQIKTPFTNKILGTYPIKNIENYNIIDSSIQEMVENRLVEGYLPNIPELIYGEYYKIQLAFINADLATEEQTREATDGYYSTVATIKYTVQPTVNIENLDAEAEVNPFTYTFQGNFNNDEEPTETRSSYCFEIFSNFEGESTPEDLIQSSGWLIRDPNKKQDTYTFDDIEGCTIYKLKYSVKTINNLIVESPYYRIEQAEVASDIEQDYDVIVENNFDNAYVIARIQPKESLSLDPQNVNGMFRLLRRSSLEDRFIEVGRKHIVLNNDNHYTEEFRDFLIEQGETYVYKVQQYNDHNIYSIKKPNTAAGEVPAIITVDFEDSFLWDGEKQLKLRFNPKVSSFKIDRQEQKMETSGSQFPFFTRNGKIAYHEFPISGLCSYLMDEEQLFMKDNELGLINDPITISDARQQTAHSSDEDSAQRRGRTTNLVNYNFLAERRFKNKVLEWLGNGKPKFYKSPSEGNFIVRLMNPSLSPEDKTSRMIHNFSATAYELMEINSKNILENKFYKNNDEDNFTGSGYIFNKIKSLEKTDSNIKYLVPNPSYCGPGQKTDTNQSQLENYIQNYFTENERGNLQKIMVQRRWPMTIIDRFSFTTTDLTGLSGFSNVTIRPATYIKNGVIKYYLEFYEPNSSTALTLNNPLEIFYCRDALAQIVVFENKQTNAGWTERHDPESGKAYVYQLDRGFANGRPICAEAKDDGKYYWFEEGTATADLKKANAKRYGIIDILKFPAVAFADHQMNIFDYPGYCYHSSLTTPDIKLPNNDSEQTMYRTQTISLQTNPYVVIKKNKNVTAPYVYNNVNPDSNNCNIYYQGRYDQVPSESEPYIFNHVQDFFTLCVGIHTTNYLKLQYYNNYRVIYDDISTE